MKLFFNQTSPYARKTRVAAHELGMTEQIEWVEVDPWAEPHDLTGANPLSKVPVLRFSDGRSITESDTIIQALAALVPNSAILPGSTRGSDTGLARAALCQGLIDASFIIVIEGRRPPDRQWSDWVARQERAIMRALLHIEMTFDLPAERFDIGDIGLACALAYLDFRLPALAWREGRPRTAAWFDKVRLRPSMTATAPC